MDPLGLLRDTLALPGRIVRALDDVAAIAERARRDPDPVEEVRVRIDALLLELELVRGVAREIVDGGADLNRTAKALDRTGRDIHDGGQDLTAVARALERDTRELIDGGSRLTAASEDIESDLSVFRAAMPRLLSGLDTVDELEDAVETVADTVEPLQGAAERVGRATNRLGRKSA